jgi:hypothetical protein
MRKVIEWAFFKWVAEDMFREAKEELEVIEAFDEEVDLADCIIEFEPDEGLVEELGREGADRVTKGILELFGQFETEEDQAMYEKKFSTLH